MKIPKRLRVLLSILFLMAVGSVETQAAVSPKAADGYKLFAKSNLVAWCIVPFDSKKRGPEERAAMLEKLGLSQFAYDYRAEHIRTFDGEIEALQRHHVQLAAWWFPTALNDEARLILEVLKRHKVRPQLWVMGGGSPTRTPEEQRSRVEAEAKRVGEIAVEAVKIGSMVGLYNHGEWFGEPENQIEIIQRLRSQNITNVGIVYNQHHGHGHIDRFPQLMQQMKPYLLAVNINGMIRGGDRIDRKIVPLGQGELDLKLLRIIQASGWRGPIGILSHAPVDAEARLRDNLEGLEWLKTQLDGGAPGPKPQPRSWPEPKP